jgi:hypothetical protein
MVKLGDRPCRRTALDRARARRGRRGMAVIVVVLVLMMISGIGIFSARAASLATASAGSMRQMSQTHYLTEYAMQSAFAELASDRQAAYIQVLSNSASGNNANNGGASECKNLANVPNRTCLKLTERDLLRILQVQNPSGVFLVPAGAPIFAGGPAAIPGSLGFANNLGDFAVEITDLSPVAAPVAGSDVAASGGAAMSFYLVTLSATGQIFANPIGDVDPTFATFNRTAALSASQELSRAHVIVGPLPAKL